MRQTELILFIVVMLINGGIALYKKHKQREAARAARSLENLATSARAESKDVRPVRTPAAARAKTAAARTAPAPVPARPVAPSAGPAPERAKSMAQVVEELERRVRERMSAGAPPGERVIPSTAVPPAPAAVPVIARVAVARPGTAVGAVNVARGRPSLGTRRALRDAIIASEVLGRPRADRPFGA